MNDQIQAPSSESMASLASLIKLLAKIDARVNGAREIPVNQVARRSL